MIWCYAHKRRSMPAHGTLSINVALHVVISTSYTAPGHVGVVAVTRSVVALKSQLAPGCRHTPACCDSTTWLCDPTARPAPALIETTINATIQQHACIVLRGQCGLGCCKARISRKNTVKMAGKKEHRQDGGKEGTSSRWRERRNIVKMAGKKEHRQDGGKEGTSSRWRERKSHDDFRNPLDLKLNGPAVSFSVSASKVGLDARVCAILSMVILWPAVCLCAW